MSSSHGLGNAISSLVDVDKSHLPNVQDQDGLVGLVLFCVILELSNVLHPGTYDDDHPMSDKERIILIEARKYARSIVRWLRTYFIFSEGEVENIDVFDVLLWQVAMTLASAIEETQENLGSYHTGCTPDKVACALYDTLVSQDLSIWESRGQLVATSYDWEGGKIVIQPRDGATMPPDEENGLTECDICHIDKISTPSFNEDITMSRWLQTE